MDRDQVALLMAKASGAFRNSAPDFKRNPQIFEIYCEALRDIDGRRALANLDHHIQTGNFFPTVAEIVRADLVRVADAELLKIEYAHHEALQEEWFSRAVDPPAHVLERWGKR